MDVNRRSIPKVAGWIAFLVSSLAFLVIAGGERLAPPPLRSPGQWGTWMAERDPVNVAVSVLRVAGIAFGIYLVTITVIAVLASALRSRRLTKVSARLTTPWLRHTLGGLLGAGLVVAGLPQHSPVPVGPEPVTTATRSAEVAAFDQRDRPNGLPVQMQETDPPVVMSLLPGGSAPEHPPATALSPPTMSLDDPGAVAPAQPPPAISEAVADTWVIAPGDHLWGVAEAVVTDEFGRPPTEAEIAAYWTVLIEANRAMLVDPSNPDLVFAGQVLVLPPVGSG